MPGELGDPQEQQQIGHYEGKYVPSGDWQNPDYATVESWEKLHPRNQFLIKMVEDKNKDK